MTDIENTILTGSENETEMETVAAVAAATVEEAPTPREMKKEKAPKRAEEAAPRRVGTLTMGVSFIAVGVFLLVSAMQGTAGFSSFNYGFVAKFAPLLVILLGVEVLYGHFRAGGARVKVDFASSFVCLGLALASVLCTIIPASMEEYGLSPDQQAIRMALRTQMETACTTALAGENVYSCSVYTNLYGVKYPDMPRLEDLVNGESAQVSLEIGSCATREEFAQKAYNLAQKLANTGVNVYCVNISSLETDHGYYHVRLDQITQLGVTLEGVLDRVNEVTYDVSNVQTEDGYPSYDNYEDGQVYSIDGEEYEYHHDENGHHFVYRHY